MAIRLAAKSPHAMPAPEILNAAANLLGLPAERLSTALLKLERPEEEKLLSRKDAATYLGIDSSTLKNWSQDGVINQIRLGYKTVKYRLSDLEALVAASSSMPASRNGARPRNN